MQSTGHSTQGHSTQGHSTQPKQTAQATTPFTTSIAQPTAALPDSFATVARSSRTRVGKARATGKARVTKPSAIEALREAALQSCDDMIRVEAALDSLLTLLYLQGEINPNCIGLHALLLPVKDQVGASAGRLNAHL